MRIEKIGVIAVREYLARIRTKGFWIATVGLPLLMGAVLVLPALLLTQTTSSHRLAIVDTTGRLGEALTEELSGGLPEALENIDPTQLQGIVPLLESPTPDPEQQRAQLAERTLTGEIDAWVWIDEDGLARDRIEYHATSVSNFVTQERLQRAVSTVVRSFRLEEAGIDPAEIARLQRSVDLTTLRVTETGTHEEQAATGVLLAYTLFFMLYIAILVYGQQVMVGVLEEKSSRIVEVIVATVRPVELMTGKLVGICCVALTQLGIWLTALAVLTLPGVIAAAGTLPAGLELPTLEPTLVLHFLAFFVLGFVLFSSFYGAVGAAFNNIQEAQQFAGIGAIFAIAPMLLFWMVLNDPDSLLSVVASLIPFFTPLLMLLRLAVKAPPWWQVALGYALTLALALGSIWLAARIYRVGILMYGKKPSLPEIWRWIRYA